MPADLEWRDARRHPARPQEGMEMAVLHIAAAMGVVVILTVGFGVEHVIARIVFHLHEIALTLEHFADHVKASLFQHAIALRNFLARRPHSGALYR